MFSKWGAGEEDIKTKDNGNNNVDSEKDLAQDNKEEKNEKRSEKKIDKVIKDTSVNTILKGSKLTGDINVTCDLELSGDVEGNIKSLKDSNIVIKGSCKGNIETKEGNVDIVGELHSGNIIAGNNVTISGKFSGGEVKAKGKIYVNGEFNGKLEGNEVEIGANAQGKGEIFYKEFISISRGAKVEVQVSRFQEGLKAVKNPPEKNVVDIQPAKEQVNSK